jgi:hypothetical protein
MSLTQLDLDEIEKLIETKIKYLPTKNELYGRFDAIMGELQAIREEMVLISHKSADHEDRIEELETIHPDGKHVVL